MRFDIFAKRGKPAPDVLHHDLPPELRVQICGIVEGAVVAAGYDHDSYDDRLGYFYERLHSSLAHELGRFVLSNARAVTNARGRVRVFITDDSAEYVLSLLDVLFSLLIDDARASNHRAIGAATAAAQELNQRFAEHGAGFRIENLGETLGVVKVTSTHLHKDVVRPALEVLHDPDFAAADAEFRKAHEHYRHARREEAIAGCLKALESTLKVICTRRDWPFDEKKDTAKRLIDIVFDRGLVPDHLKSEFGALRTVLESGVPTIRNRSGGHGAGAKPRAVPESLAAYTLHLTAATILFLAQLEKGR